MDRRRLGVLALLGILMVGSACGGGAPASRPSGGGEAAPAAAALKGDAEKGKELFLGTCASC
ncbi:hypothetical protein SAMN02746019_00012970, partial [Thermoflexus hugenholtzii JAD2]